MDDQALDQAVAQILANIDPDPQRPGLTDTPRRVRESLQELTSGYHQDPMELMTTFDAEDYQEIIAVTDIPFYSLCEHHLLPFHGRASVFYIPSGKIIGLSKIARLVEIFARRLQVQERMTWQVADALQRGLQPRGTMVIVEAEHMCMAMRGIKKTGTLTKTSNISGLFATDPATRHEALRLFATQN